MKRWLVVAVILLTLVVAVVWLAPALLNNPQEGGLSFVASEADPSTGRIFLVDRTYGLVVLDSHTGNILHTGFMPPGPGAAAIVIDPGTHQAFVAVSTDPYGGIRTGPTLLSVLDTRTLHILYTTKLGIGPTSLALDTRTDRLVAANQGDDTAMIVSADSGAILHVVQVAAWPSPVVVDTQLDLAYILGRTPDHQAHELSVLAIRTGMLIRVIHDIGRSSGSLTAAVVDEATHTVFLANNGSGDGPTPTPSLEARDGRTGQQLRSMSIWPRALVVDSQAARLFVTEEDDTVWIVNATTGGIVQKVSLPNYQRTSSVQEIVLDLLTQHIFVAGYWPGITMLDAKTGKILRPRQQSNWTTELVLDQPDQRVVTAGILGVALFDTRSGNVVRTLRPEDFTRFCTKTPHYTVKS
jgi:DNA-binding beta-propeller fold protein YncE